MFSMPQKKAPYHKIRLHNIRFIVSNRVQMFSMPQKKPLTTKSDFKTSALSFQIESKCFLCLKKKPLTTKSVFKTSALSLQIESKCFLCLKKKPLTTKSDFKTSALSFEIESKCFLCLKQGPLPQNPCSKHLLYHCKSSPNVFYASKKAPYDKIRLQNICLIISNRVQMFSMPQKSPLPQNPTSKHPLDHFKSCLK